MEAEFSCGDWWAAFRCIKVTGLWCERSHALSGLHFCDDLVFVIVLNFVYSNSMLVIEAYFSYCKLYSCIRCLMLIYLATCVQRYFLTLPHNNKNSALSVILENSDINGTRCGCNKNAHNQLYLTCATNSCGRPTRNVGATSYYTIFNFSYCIQFHSCGN